MNIGKLIGCLTVFGALCACGGGGGSSKTVTPETGEPLSTAMEQIRSGHGIPALAGAYLENGAVVESHAAGNRSVDSSVPVTNGDRWHLGSITKSMTATLAARLVEQGIVRWDMTIGEALPQLRDQINADYSSVSLEQLLSHRGATMNDLTRLPGWSAYFTDTSPVTEQRLRMTRDILNRTLPRSVGSYTYSNAGYIVAGTMLEAVTGMAWEQLLEQELFSPLDIEDAGFGAPTINAPLGHRQQNGRWQAVPATDAGSDNPAALGPAGTVHLSVQSMLKYAQLHIEGERGESSYLTQSSFQRLHGKSGGDHYAFGWFLDGETLFHDGSNTMWFAKLAIDLEQGIAIAAVTNAGGDDGNAATDDVVNLLLRRNR